MPIAKKASARKAPARKGPAGKAPAAAPSASRFEGFAGEDMKFFKALARHQDRAWFAAHKSEYEEGWARPMAALMAEAAERLDAAYPRLAFETL